MADKIPQWMMVVAALGGGGVIGGGGTSILSNKDPRVESLQFQVTNMQATDKAILDTKASKEYVTLKIQALCK